jgi:hypothetical protein
LEQILPIKLLVNWENISTIWHQERQIYTPKYEMVKCGALLNLKQNPRYEHGTRDDTIERIERQVYLIVNNLS